ncbi:MAG: hypothetical protein KJI69_00510 [Patescibacteria group bacterium]|nr:hypothetical protein [Patescibacteria group bacterium]
MNIDEQFKDRLTATFRPLNTVPASRTFPAPATLADSLRRIIPRAGMPTRSVTPQFAAYFGTAAVEIWHRSVHSFMISASLTEASPIWASVSGYYSSHYSVRGIAHLLGYFYLFTRKIVAKLELGVRGGYTCSFSRRPRDISPGGEHQLYWALVKRNPVFIADPIFTENRYEIDESDAAHRNFANYTDHICRHPIFHPLDERSIKTRVDQISKIILDDAPIPRLSEFPDVEYVQLIAYHRIVSFRKILDNVLGDDNRFWKVHRNPSFATEFMDFQLIEGSGLSQPS